jgi:hypothetical protein
LLQVLSCTPLHGSSTEIFDCSFLQLSIVSRILASLNLPLTARVRMYTMNQKIMYTTMNPIMQEAKVCMRGSHTSHSHPADSILCSVSGSQDPIAVRTTLLAPPRPLSPFKLGGKSRLQHYFDLCCESVDFLCRVALRPKRSQRGHVRVGS